MDRTKQPMQSTEIKLKVVLNAISFTHSSKSYLKNAFHETLELESILYIQYMFKISLQT